MFSTFFNRKNNVKSPNQGKFIVWVITNTNNMLKISDHLIQDSVDTVDDASILHLKSFPVNLRLYRASKEYKKIILQIITYMDIHLRSTFTDYSNPKGIAAPALGFPLRIIGFKKGYTEINQFCINPEITSRYGGQQLITTKSGSLRLNEPIQITRWLQIDFKYYDLDCEEIKVQNISRMDGCFTIQHEIDLLDGVTISDKAGVTQQRPKLFK